MNNLINLKRSFFIQIIVNVDTCYTKQFNILFIKLAYLKLFHHNLNTELISNIKNIN